jgi:transcriptional regulator with XRE-family HTH domain
MKKFGDWLTQKLIDVDMKPADLSRATGMDSAVISNLINGKRNPAVESCKAISKALNIPLEEVYRAAGILPPKPEIDPVTETILNLLLDLQVDDKKDILEYAKLRHKLAAERHDLVSNTKRSSQRIAPT